MPNRRNGTESVTTLGVMSRNTITSDGLTGMSLDDMVRFWIAGNVKCSCGCLVVSEAIGDLSRAVVRLLGRLVAMVRAREIVAVN